MLFRSTPVDGLTTRMERMSIPSPVETQTHEQNADATYPAQHVIQTLERALLFDPRVLRVLGIHDRVTRKVLLSGYVARAAYDERGEGAGRHQEA